MKNIYYSPDLWGLDVVGEIDYSVLDYHFDRRVVWKNKETCALYTARDAGCSCPTPFEDYRGLEDLDILDYQALENEVKSEASRSKDSDMMKWGREFLNKVSEAMSF